MAARIHLLPPQLASQVAAGEVIERPASVVKELLENSLDAEAKQIAIEIECGGSKLIRIRDDGCGIHPDDLALALSRHATSKIAIWDDLQRLTSMGFRGEALASISAVSRFTLTSCQQQMDMAWEITSSDGRCKPAAHPLGTTVEVADLFYNVPARRKFLRAEKTEFACIETVVQRLALAYFNIGFSLKHHDRIVLKLPVANTEILREKRIQTIFGKLFLEHARYFEVAIGSMRLSGWVATSDFSRHQTDLQYLYVNGRAVQDKTMTHAIRQAYQDDLPIGRYPAFIIYLEMDTHFIDVNVHPTKQEVRFRDNRTVHDFICSTIRDVLAQRPVEVSLLPAMDFAIAEEKADWEILPAPVVENTDVKIIGIFYHRFVLVEQGQKLILIDQQQVQQRRAYDTLNALEMPDLQPLLFPVTVPVTTEQAVYFSKHKSLLLKLGLDMDQLSPTTWIIRYCHALFRGVAFQDLITDLVRLGARDEMVQCMAKHIAIAQMQSMSVEKVRELIDVNQFSTELTALELEQWCHGNAKT